MNFGAAVGAGVLMLSIGVNALADVSPDRFVASRNVKGRLLADIAGPSTLQSFVSTNVDYVEVWFESPLPTLTEVELWPAMLNEAGEVVPYRGMARGVWITDDRTGPLVRFDITDIFLAWQRNELENHGVVIQVSESNEESQARGFSEAMSLHLVVREAPGENEEERGSPRDRRSRIGDGKRITDGHEGK